MSLSLSDVWQNDTHLESWRTWRQTESCCNKWAVLCGVTVIIVCMSKCMFKCPASDCSFIFIWLLSFIFLYLIYNGLDYHSISLFSLLFEKYTIANINLLLYAPKLLIREENQTVEIISMHTMCHSISNNYVSCIIAYAINIINDFVILYSRPYYKYLNLSRKRFRMSSSYKFEWNIGMELDHIVCIPYLSGMYIFIKLVRYKW